VVETRSAVHQHERRFVSASYHFVVQLAAWTVKELPFFFVSRPSLNQSAADKQRG
jgi:hypothetical protein